MVLYTPVRIEIMMRVTPVRLSTRSDGAVYISVHTRVIRMIQTHLHELRWRKNL